MFSTRDPPLVDAVIAPSPDAPPPSAVVAADVDVGPLQPNTVIAIRTIASVVFVFIVQSPPLDAPIADWRFKACRPEISSYEWFALSTRKLPHGYSIPHQQTWLPHLRQALCG
jgi:hypothetical protein